MKPIVRIGARASQLSQAQSRQVQAKVAVALGYEPGQAEEVAPLVLITTTGDRIQDRRLMEAGGKGLFTKEIEQALLDGRVDLAVHSLKDVPAEDPEGLALAAFPEREDPRDVIVSLTCARFEDLPPGARLGTASLRRQAQSLHRRPDLEIVMMRGNVDTRLKKLEAGEADAILLAMSGLKRLGLDGRAAEAIDPFECPPAPGQGALALQTRAGDVGQDWLRSLDHAETRLCVAAERGAMAALEGSCRTAIGAHARIEHGRLSLVVEALNPDGVKRWRRQGLAPATSEEKVRALGLQLGHAVREDAGDELIVA
jgi:hydroxymethylbilane synthase